MAASNVIRPGSTWLDTDGAPIHVHGGSIRAEDGLYYWYGENKERSAAGSGIWHWGVRCYSSPDLVHWTDRGLIIPPDESDRAAPLHPAQLVDRPHIVRNPRTGHYVCWLKIMQRDGTQRSTVLVADRLLGPYRIVRTHLLPLGMSAGDFDLVVDPSGGRAYYYFERVHSELVCADLDDTWTDVAGSYSTHLPRGGPPLVREAPAYFRRGDAHYLVTSGTTGYFPNASEVARAWDYHGPWEVLGDPHVGDTSRTSFNSQISSVFRHPAKRDLYIAVADRWIPALPDVLGDAFASGEAAAAVRYVMAEWFDRDGKLGVKGSAEIPPVDPDLARRCEPLLDLHRTDTRASTHVWLPFRFDGDMPRLEWRDEWSPDDYE